MGLGLGFGYDAAPDEAVAAADRLGFPLFEIPYQVPFIALTEAVFTRISDARVAEAVRRLAGDLVEAVLSGEAGVRELRRRSRAFGLRGTLPLSFLALRPATDEAATLARLAEAAGRFGPASVRDGVVAVLIEARDDGAAERTAADVLHETGAGAAGVGRVRTDPGELARSYDEALYAVEAKPVNGTPAVATFRDLGSIQLLLSLGDERGVELYCESMLGPLRAHDARYGSALLESLAAYIEANGRWADAAAALGVHRHTLRYRIRKIETLTGRKPTDARDRLELWLALRAHELQGRRELEPVP
jgi:PucR C-terminal helix-turn-helix domain/GGDEF-like domain/Purine catabolism regulatory protein-like family